jgi:predicted kinase
VVLGLNNLKRNKMKQTAIQWLMEELESYGDRQHCKLEWEDLESLIQQALEKEKNQIIDAANIPFKDRGYDATKFSNIGEQYYSKTYVM